MDSLPLVSVVIPAFNNGKYIEDTISSVLKQTYANYEIIVIDDSSTDDTYQIVEQLSKLYAKINIYRIEHTGRPSVPRNFGIKKASGSLIAFLDGDDLWTPDKLETQVKYILKNPDVAFLYSMSVTMGVSIFSPKYEVLPLLNKAAKSYNDLITKGNSVTCSTVLAKKIALEEVNGFDEDPELKVEDYDLWIRLSQKFSFLFINYIHCYYRIHSSQFSSDWKIKQERVNYLAKKRNWDLPQYKYFRNKGGGYLLIRNTIHIVTFLLIKFLGWCRRFQKSY